VKPLRIFRHFPTEGPGYFAHFLGQRKIPYELIRIDAGEDVPPRLEDTSGLVFMGGPMSVNDDLPWIKQELGLIRRAAEAGLPLLGHCLGGQLISKALGGRITVNPVEEIGWHLVQRIENEAARDWLGDLPEYFEVFHWHGETFTLPEGAAPILTSRYCAQQGFVAGNILALQCHIEMTAEMVGEWVRAGGKESLTSTPSVQSEAEMMQDLSARIDTLHKVAEVFYTRWLHSLEAPL
jgi:GMP synthase-like glutamine amidotransferase